MGQESFARLQRRLPNIRLDLLQAVVGPGSGIQFALVAAVGLALGVFAVAVASLPAAWKPMAVAVLLVPVAGLVFGQVRSLLLLLVVFDTALGTQAYVGYRYDIGALGGLGGWTVSFATIALGFLYALWLAEHLARGRNHHRLELRAALPSLLYLCFVALSVLVARDPSLALYQVFLLTQIILVFIYIASTVRTWPEITLIVTALLAGMLLQALIMIAVAATGVHIAIGNISTMVSAEFGYRVGGTLGSPNSAAGFLVMPLALALAVMLTNLPGPIKLLAAASLAAGSFAIVLTQSRGGWFGFAFAVAMVTALAWKRGWLSLKVPLLLAGLGGVLFVLFYDVFVSRANEQIAAFSRVPLMQLTFNVVRDHPLLGVGGNNFSQIIAEYATPEFSGQWLYTVHNQYLLIWSETGTLALLSYLLFIGVTLRHGVRCWRSSDRDGALLALGLMAGMLGHMVHGLVDYFNTRVHLQAFWLFAALLVSLHHARRERPIDSQPDPRTVDGPRPARRAVRRHPAGRFPGKASA